VADNPSDGNVRVSWVTTIANKAAPTVAELNAGLLLTSLMTSDGLAGWAPETESIGNRKLDSTFESSDVGSISMEDPALRFYKQVTGDTIYTTLVKNAAGFVVIRRVLASGTAWAASQLLVGVFPAKCAQRKWIDMEPNTMDRWEVQMKITAEPAFDAVVA
jgi:hypothetical protein